jgi:hypothetical protein
LHRVLTFTVCGALVGASAILVVGTGGEVGASEPNPVQVTCTSQSGRVGPSSGSDTLSDCNHQRITGGGGAVSTIEGINGSVTISVTWNSGLTTVDPTGGRVVSGKSDLCQPPRGYINDSEVKWEGTVTGGTASALVGGAARSTICLFSKINKPNTHLIENKPNTYVIF